jgi:hypothetical protein
VVVVLLWRWFGDEVLRYCCGGVGSDGTGVRSCD